MISLLKGTLVTKSAHTPKGAFFVVDLHGLGMEVLTSDGSINQAPAVGEPIQLYTSLMVREDALFLVGFMTKEERDLYNILQSASGVGVKVSLALLSTLSVSDIVQAVVSGNFKLLSSAKGVGPKLAQKITLDLKEKMKQWREIAVESVEAGDLAVTSEGFLEAETVLLSLGYTQAEVVKSLNAIQPSLPEAEPSSEVVLREALRWLATL